MDLNRITSYMYIILVNLAVADGLTNLLQMHQKLTVQLLSYA